MMGDYGGVHYGYGLLLLCEFVIIDAQSDEMELAILIFCYLMLLINVFVKYKEDT